MKRPMVALLLAPGREERLRARRGKKAITIREGHRDYQAGDTLLIACHVTRWRGILARVTSVRHTTLGEVTEQEYRDNDYRSPEAMRTDLRAYYLNINLDSPVTVIRWEMIR